MATEKRLIDADSVLRKAQDPTYQVCGTRKVSERAVTWVMALVGSEPPVDAVEVVRCKDCRWARPQDHREPVDTPKDSLICQCFMHHHIPAPWGARLAVNPDDFCSKGERRNDG